MSNKEFGRPKNTEKLRFYIQDSENPMSYSPQDYNGNKFIGTWSKLTNLHNTLNFEQREKYIMPLNAQRKAELELHTIPQCFD